MLRNSINIKDSSIYQLIFNKNERNFILDPLTCLIRLSILEFKPIGTKISIYNNKISYNEPCIFQGSVRWTYGDNRGDLHNLFNPIKKVFVWYDSSKDEISGISNFSIKGLKKLKESYESNSIISHSLDHYITLLKDRKKETIQEDDEYNIIYKNLKQLWNEREINIVYNILLELEALKKTKNKDDNKKNSLIRSLDSILSMKEDYINKLLLESTTILK